MAFLLVSAGCRKPETEDTGHSAEFKIIFKKYDTINRKNKPELAFHYLDSATRHMANPTSIDIFRFYGLHWLYHRKVSRNAEMELVYADSMMMIAKKNFTTQYIANYAEANFAMGDSYFDLGKFNAAYKCYYDGYVTGKNSFKPLILSEYTYRMGMVMFKQGHYREAAAYFKESFKQIEFRKNSFAVFYQRQEVLDNIGECYKNYGNLDSASFWFSKTLELIKSNREANKASATMLDIADAVVYGNQGEVALLQGKYPEAERLLLKSLAINLVKGRDNYNAELVEINLGKVYFNTQQYDKFFKLFASLRQQLDTIKNEEAEANWNLLMSQYYKVKGEPGKGFAYLENYTALKDSVLKRANSLKEIDITQQQANYDKQYKINALELNNKTQQGYTWMAATSAVLVAIIMVLVFRNWRRSKKDVQVVSALNSQINLQKDDLEHTLEELRSNAQEKDRILHAVAHDLRNPLGGIAALTSVMADDELEEEQMAMVSIINETANNSLELINEILEATKNSTKPVRMELVDINSVMGNSVELLRYKAAEKAQKIRLKLLDTPQELMMSRENIWRVINNIVINAIKFSPADTVIDIRLTNLDDVIEIAIKDNGIGIPADLKNKVFNTFTDARRPGTAGEKSFGLGLSICKQIIELHQGKIWFESGKKGTTFHFSLPKPVKDQSFNGRRGGIPASA